MNALIRRSLSVGMLLCVLPTSAGARGAPEAESVCLADQLDHSTAGKTIVLFVRRVLRTL